MGDFLWGSVIIPNMERVRTTFVCGRERVVVIGEADKGELSHQMKIFSFASRANGLRPGQVGMPEGSKIAVSGDAMAVINALTPDGGSPMSPDLDKVKVLRYSRLVYRAGE